MRRRISVLIAEILPGFTGKINSVGRALALVMLAGMLVLPACSSPAGFAHRTGTQVDLGKKNYRIVKANAIGTSRGFWFLGIIPFFTTSYTDAISDMCGKAGLQEGKAQAYVNVAEEESTIYLLLFSLPKLTVRADIVEFTE